MKIALSLRRVELAPGFVGEHARRAARRRVSSRTARAGRNSGGRRAWASGHRPGSAQCSRAGAPRQVGPVRRRSANVRPRRFPPAIAAFAGMTERRTGEQWSAPRYRNSRSSSRKSAFARTPLRERAQRPTSGEAADESASLDSTRRAVDVRRDRRASARRNGDRRVHASRRFRGPARRARIARALVVGAGDRVRDRDLVPAQRRDRVLRDPLVPRAQGIFLADPDAPRRPARAVLGVSVRAAAIPLDRHALVQPVPDLHSGLGVPLDRDADGACAARRRISCARPARSTGA